jgi:hypothetical protein
LAMSAAYEIVDRLGAHREAIQHGNCGGHDGGTRAACIVPERRAG